MPEIELKTGILQIPESELLNNLTGFGSRINKKRGFLFLNKLLGKHIPSRPSLMELMHKQLADKILSNLTNNNSAMIIGFAETATGLGFGVYEQLNLPDSFYIHTTRYNLSNKNLLNFQEEHCHAPSHILYEVTTPELKNLINKINTIILIDDEITTGRTAENFIKELKKAFPKVRNYFVASVLNWMPVLSSDIDYIYLYRDKFNFIPKDYIYSEKITSISNNKSHLDKIIPYNFGRFGIKNCDIDVKSLVNPDLLKDKKVLVLGTGELMHPAYLIGKYLETCGIDVYIQSTTRSPVNIDHDILSKLSFKDNYHENIDNFIYNVSDKKYDKIFICYETVSNPENHNLKELLKVYCKDVEEIFIKAN